MIGRVDYAEERRRTACMVRYYIYNYTAQAFFDGKNALTTGPNPGNKDQSNTVTFGDTYTINADDGEFVPCDVQSARGQSRLRPEPVRAPALGMKLNENMPDNYIQITVGNYFNVACGTCAPGYFNVNNYQLSDDFQMTSGKHQFAFGFDGRKQQFNSTNNQQSNGQFTFSGGTTTGYSGDNLADLADRPSRPP